MQRLIAFGRRHGRDYISGSSLSSSSSSFSSSPKKVFFSNFNLIPCQLSSSSSSSSCNSDSKDDFHIVMNILSNSAPSRRGHQIYSALDAALDVTTLIQQQQHFVLKVIETSCQPRLVHTLRVSPYDLIHYIKLVWKNNKDLITTPVVESLVSSICCCSTTVSTPPTKNDILYLWNFLKHIARHHPPGLLNARILNTLIQSFSIMGRGEGKAALEVFNKFQDFHCVPNHDTYYFTLQALLNSSCSPDMIHQAASICQNMLLLFPHDHLDGGSSYDQEYTQPPPSPDDSDSDFQIALTFLGGIPRPYLEG
ncbi:pentatricopeptide repeat-containing protein, partial [Trifolium medium]|nr:pentatricopeptide repeat-containing protein [Trifolium medium]